jgi:hypothetical protein
MAAKKPTPKRAMPAPMVNGGSRSIDIRKISNGHIIRESNIGKDGNFASKETYSPSPPMIQMSPTPTPKPAPMPKKPAAKPMQKPAMKKGK